MVIVYKTKNGMVEPACVLFHKWKKEGKPVQILRCIIAGENVTLKTRSDSTDWKLGINFEFTARITPQQKCPVEVGFMTVGRRGWAMMIATNIPYALYFKLYCETYQYATMLESLVVIDLDGVGKTRLEHWGVDLLNWTMALCTWVEAGVVTLTSRATPKMANNGLTCMFVGYAPNHANGVYRMWNLCTGRVHISRDFV